MIALTSTGAYAVSLQVSSKSQINSHIQQWHQVHSNPAASSSLFVLNRSSGIFVTSNKKLVAKPVISIAELGSPEAEITAFSLHPSFISNEQEGFGLLYTAHLEPRIKQQNKLASLEGSEQDAVLIEWKIDIANGGNSFLNKREITRLELAENFRISQLSFNPFAKVWDESFGQLFIALSAAGTNSETPIYSGSILRINPNQFGLRQFTIPQDNPFIDSELINNTLYIAGLGEVSEFIWPEKDKKNLLVRHKKNGQHQLTIMSAGQTFQQTTLRNSIAAYKSPLLQQAMVSYQGSKLSHLKGMTLLLSNKNRQWELQSVKMPSQSASKRPALVEWQHDSEGENNALLSLITDSQNELLIVDKQAQTILELTTDSIIAENSNRRAPTTTTSLQNNKEHIPAEILLLSGLLLIITIVWVGRFIYQRLHSARYNIRNQFKRFEIDNTNHVIELYKSHDKKPHISIEFEKITQVSIELNRQPLFEIDKDTLFTNTDDNSLREGFALEKRKKMQSSMMREITIKLTSHNKLFVICAYLRKGDNRITRCGFTEACNKVIDLCWLVSGQLRPDDIEPRLFFPEQPEPKKTQNTLYKQPQAQPASNEETTNSVGQVELEQKPIDAVKSQQMNNSATQDKIDTELITALQKLADLRAQGALTEDEFNQAKQRILQGLIS